VQQETRQLDIKTMSIIQTNPFSVNNRTYSPAARPVAVICLDGSADAYFDAALAHGLMPNLERISRHGHRGTAVGALPSFTNTNNSSIITGVPPSIHGMCGNFFYDTTTGREVMMNSGSYLRCATIPAAAAQAGRKVAVVTAKEKLRDIIGHGLKGIAISAEFANQAVEATHGISGVEKLVGLPTPSIYSADASLYVLRAGVALIRNGLADFLYLSTTDYIQHTAAPEEKPALDFYAAIDVELGRLCESGAVVGLTADHGMNPKQTPDGRPNVIFLQSWLKQELLIDARVILPITDPYVVHHGALGSYAMIHLPEGAPIQLIKQRLLQVPGISEVHLREDAARELELPVDRIGDLIVLSEHNVALGKSPEYHDLGVLHAGLRSHGGRAETAVPFIISEPLIGEYRTRSLNTLRNFDIYEFTVNGTHA
jgi:phosphonoacetate hydrolase